MVRDIFSHRLDLLIKTYALTYLEVAGIVGAKNKTSVYNWAKGRTFPGEDMLSLLSSIFAVSIDWLIGNVNTPYRADFLLKLEEEKVVPLYEKSLSAVGGLLPIEYKDSKDRSECYSMGQRANLIFAALASYYETENDIKKLPGNAERFLDQLYLKFGWVLLGRKEGESLGYTYFLEKKQFDDLGKLLQGELDHPLFDLETFIKKNKNA